MAKKKAQESTGRSDLPRMDLAVFEQALENATDAIGMATPDGRHFYQNTAFSELFGVVGEDPPATLYCDAAVGREVFQKIMDGGTWTGEVQMYAKDRRVLDILLRAYAVKDQQGRLIGLVGIHTDITARRRAEEALRQSEATYREVFNTVNDTIWIHDVDTFEFIDVNARVTEMFGYSVDEALGLSVDDISSGVHPYTQQTAAELLGKAAAGEAQLFDWHTRHKDGHLFWTEVSLKRGSVAGRDCLLAIERDITERKKEEEILRRMRALESLGTVAGGIAHDFNNLLTGVFGNLELSSLDLPPDHPARTSVRDALRALEDARHLATRLLTFAKGGDPVLEAVDLRRRIRDTVRFHLAGSKVSAHFDLPEDLWPARADKGQLVEVVSNLTINAKEAMPAGGAFHVRARNVPRGEAAALPGLDGDCVELAFEDEGVGIPASIAERIFEPYFSSKQAGSGLGLAIVHGIVSRHMGHISLDSTPDAGATFTILFLADTTGHPDAVAAATRSREALPRVSKSVLVMDDEEVIRKILSEMLARLGCRVETASDGEDAIDKYRAASKRRDPFDLTIMDLTVPGAMGGKEAVAKLLTMDPSARVVVSSGYSSDPVLVDYSKYGFVGRLAKPFTFKEIEEALRSAFGAEASLAEDLDPDA